MRMYAHDYIWGVQDRRVHPGPGFGLIDLAFWLHRRLRRAAGAARRRASARSARGRSPLAGESGSPPVALTRGPHRSTACGAPATG